MAALMRDLASRLALRMREQIPTREPGQAMTEYALILAGVSLVTIFAIGTLGAKVAHVINTVVKSIP